MGYTLILLVLTLNCGNCIERDCFADFQKYTYNKAWILFGSHKFDSLQPNLAFGSWEGIIHMLRHKGLLKEIMEISFSLFAFIVSVVWATMIFCFKIYFIFIALCSSLWGSHNFFRIAYCGAKPSIGVKGQAEMNILALRSPFHIPASINLFRFPPLMLVGGPIMRDYRSNSIWGRCCSRGTCVGFDSRQERKTDAFFWGLCSNRSDVAFFGLARSSDLN